jgi:hypothetical protein
MNKENQILLNFINKHSYKGLNDWRLDGWCFTTWEECQYDNSLMIPISISSAEAQSFMERTIDKMYYSRPFNG